MNKLIVWAVLLVAVVVGQEREVWHSKIFAAEVVGITGLAAVIWTRVHWSAALAWLSSMLSCAWVFSPFMPYGKDVAGLGGAPQYGLVGSMSFELQAIDSAVFILLVTLPFLFLRREGREAIRTGLSWACLLNSLFVVAQAALRIEPGSRSGLLGNPSMNACTIAATWPLIDDRMFNWISEKVKGELGVLLERAVNVAAFFAPIAALFLSHSSMAVGVACVVAAVILVGHMRFRTAIIGSLLCWALVLVPAYFIFHGNKGLFHDGDRFLIWNTEMGWWWANASHWFGTGQGTIVIWGPWIQRISGVRANVSWWWLHNDVLQLLFEQGVFGVVAYACLFWNVVRQAWRRQRFELVAAAFGILATSLGNYGFRMSLSCIFAVYVAADALMTDREASRFSTRAGTLEELRAA